MNKKGGVNKCGVYKATSWKKRKYTLYEIQYNLDDSNTDGSFTVDDSNSF